MIFQGTMHTSYRQSICPDQLVNEAKILSVFKDSLCFLQIPLSSFPKSFGLTEQQKGSFPHFLNIPANRMYMGPIPALDYHRAEFEK